MEILSGMPHLCCCTTSRQAMFQRAHCAHLRSVANAQAPERARQLRGKPLSQSTRVYARARHREAASICKLKSELRRSMNRPGEFWNLEAASGTWGMAWPGWSCCAAEL